MTVRLGTRGSKLALAQAGWVAEQLGDAEVVPVKTDDGEVGDKERFVRGIEEALLAGEVDIGVHSAKDLPGRLPDGLTIAGVPGREDPADAWIGEAQSLDGIHADTRVGTSSLRRRAQLLALRPRLVFSELRGNVDTRLEKLRGGELDGIVLAAAGLQRLGRGDEIAFRFPIGELTPAPGQGTLALEVRAGDKPAGEAAASLTDPAAEAELSAERAAVVELGASCNTPVGILARRDGPELRLVGFAGLPDASEWVRDDFVRDVAGASDAAEAGTDLGRRMAAAGAADILDRAEAMA